MKKDTDGVIYNQNFNVNHYIDEKLKDPNLKLKFGNNEFTLGEINNIIPSKEKKLDIFIEWENMCQYFAIGLVVKLNEIIKQNREFDLLKFLKRDDYPNGIDYVKKVIFPDLKPELIDGVIKKFYIEIMEKSPVTDFFERINLMKFMLNSITFMFRYEVEGIEYFVEEIAQEKFNNEVRCNYAIYTSEEMEIKAIKDFPLKELYVVPDMGLYYKTMIEYDKECTNIISYENHNGVNPYMLAYYFNDFVLNGLEGPNDITLSFLQEIRTKTNNEVKEK